jgi:hypothetical protein
MEQREIDFLEKHKNADSIVYDPEEKRVVKAVYEYLDLEKGVYTLNEYFLEYPPDNYLGTGWTRPR